MSPHHDRLPTPDHGIDGNNTQPEVTGDYLLTINETAQRLRISRWSVYNLIRANELSTVKIGRRRLVSPAALTECVKHLTEKAA
jgi:excisionase family DNA binding protein